MELIEPICLARSSKNSSANKEMDSQSVFPGERHNIDCLQVLGQWVIHVITCSVQIFYKEIHCSYDIKIAPANKNVYIHIYVDLLFYFKYLTI